MDLVCLRNRSEPGRDRLAVKGVAENTLVRKPLTFKGWTKGKRDVVSILLIYFKY